MDGPLPLWNGNFTQSCKPPFCVASGSTITLTTTYQAVVPTGNCPWFKAEMWYPGKLIHIRHEFQTTSAATPGAFFAALFYGNNSNGNGTSIQSTGLTWTANLAGYTAYTEWWVRCWAIGNASTGLLVGYGELFMGGIGLLPIPWNTPGSIAVDLTQDNYLAPQYYRSGSTAETMQHHDIVYTEMN